MKSSKLLCILLISIIQLTNCLSAKCQIASKIDKRNTFLPRFLSTKLAKEYVLNKKEINRLLKQDSIESKLGYPYRFGKAMDVDIDVIKESEKYKIGDTTFHYLSIKSSGAFSLNLIFDKLFLNENSYINIYNDDRSMAYGPIKSKDALKNGSLWTDLIKGNKICIELVNLEGHTNNDVHISKIIHGYRNTFVPNNFGDALNCNIDIACPAGNPWRKEADAVAMVLLDFATRWCSGALLNNTARDYKGYFLTAFHCLDDGDGILSSAEKSSVNNWLFRFKYESPTCNGIEGTNFVTFSGANFRAAYLPTDMTLLELYNNPKITDCVSYAGWSKNATASLGTGIHHPSGDVKKISFDNNKLTFNYNVINWIGSPSSPTFSHWVVGFDNGTTQGGSSGSPLFDQNHRVIGQLHGGESKCAPVTKYYGRFDVSWYGGGTNDSRLSNWLDPLNTGAIIMDTELPSHISGPYDICGSATYTVANLPAGAVVNWSVAPAGVLSYTASGNTATFTKIGYAESAVITATITTPCGNVTINKDVNPGNYLTIYGQGPICPNTGGNFFSSNQTMAGNYLWKLRRTDGSTPRYMMLGERSPRIDLFVYETGTFILSFSSTNSCGVSQTQIPITVVDYGCIGGYPYMIYPNPSSSELKISQKWVEDVGSAKKMSSDIFSVKLLNEKGKVLKEGKVTTNNGEIVLQVADIPNGIYYLHIYEGKNVKKQQVVISH